jgi:ribA/ribD-fused uncharacterized protein
MQSPRDIDELRGRIRSGWQPGYVLFLHPDPLHPGVIGPECLSQWYPSPMEIDGETFPTAEHYMMWYKARLFGDEDATRQVLLDDSPAVAKALGRRVRHFSTDIWTRHRFDLVYRASVAKFRQNPGLLSFLLDTKDHVLAEASPVDLIWGTGYATDDTHARNPLAWRGISLLGFALMKARDELSVTG